MSLSAWITYANCIARPEIAGCCVIGSLEPTASGLNARHACRHSFAISRRRKTHGARLIDSGCCVRINERSLDTRIRFDALAEHYLQERLAGRMRSDQRPNARSSTLNISSALISFPDGANKSRTRSNPSTFSAG